MAKLLEESCTACHADSPAVTEAEIVTLKADIPNWSIESEAGNPYLKRVFKFPDFAAALAFTNRVGELAEAEGHHPALLTEWGKVTVSWWTHAIAGLHRNDFIMAAKTDQVYK
ncbi:4a-hydroxytetrahydrobiopterin dehydratase [Synechococcales cyanobacterium C]|uniref:Putative pterin-4-alpha-carbinolamine dehydratase n=1 Tax=Petrachloros mirabilis ULC683 TaxID=2781853 RepID=A0A8K2A275_9CYAN|nr:4a-hydroxytetrahydrobiopterin dehydratase [Petrachloros mirabilis]NCJ08393.1 4a-hydroxytetrahydrobiopterin dehydratase [Petrachloros mirabilis ULC683]